MRSFDELYRIPKNEMSDEELEFYNNQKAAKRLEKAGFGMLRTATLAAKGLIINGIEKIAEKAENASSYMNEVIAKQDLKDTIDSAKELEYKKDHLKSQLRLGDISQEEFDQKMAKLQ